ncbi:hypothetical protein CB0940_04663 [Cercospora beticola]|uniref:Uncharacterized protein n=1 Tax=Cercospora beticola TaxID=122368 RepID=A0A2G5HN10_CERBT|nr:hypothetical protein CB0940_04663 [Cercospora beticola]PIA93920.1 hypothetical protein CB0940_04663 [Cercospora beticola]WPB01923.1 hypothetical protein RHO25_006556 [Cercospora beticola]
MPGREIGSQMPRALLTIEDIISAMQPILEIQPTERLVLILCGLPGSGKTSLSKAIVSDNHTKWKYNSYDDRILISQQVNTGAKFPNPIPDLLHVWWAEAEFRKDLFNWLCTSKPGTGLVLDYNFSLKQEREEFKLVVEAAGVESQLVFLNFDEDILWARVCEKNQREEKLKVPGFVKTTRAMFEEDLSTFQEPQNEDEHIARGT